MQVKAGISQLRLFFAIKLICLLVQVISSNATVPLKDNNAKCSSKPDIRIVNSEVELRNAGAIYKKSLGEIFVPDKILLTLECRSSKPIDFDFEGYLANKLYSVETSRFPNPGLKDDKECYSIVVKVETKREATGKYLCWNIDEEKKTALFVYAHGRLPPYLLHGDIGKSVIDVTVKSSETSAILPCVTTNPNVHVALYSIEPHAFKLLTLGDHLSYDPRIGFKLNFEKFPQDPFSRKYKCIAQNSSHFDVIMNLMKQDENEITKSGVKTEISTNKFPEHQSAFLCRGDSSLYFQTSANCKSSIECRLNQKCLIGETICGDSSCHCSFNGHTCSKSLRSKYRDSSDKLGEGCGTIYKNDQGGVLACGMSSKMYFIGLKGQIVENWKEAPKSEILSTSTLIEGNGGFYYVGEDIEFSCNASRFVFSKGFQWKFQLKNGTLISPPTLGIRQRLTDSYINEEVKIKISIPEIHSVLCSAPVWNETTWVNQLLPLKVRDTVAPVFFDPANITITVYPNEKNQTLICEALGYPQPDIMWLRNGEEFLTNFHFDNSIENVTKAKLTFKEIAELDHGVIYTCNASNPRGMTIKTFSIHVKAHPSTLVFSLVGVGISVFFAIVVFISIVVLRKMQNEKFKFSQFDIDEFKKGNPEAVKKCTDVSQKAVYLPYDSEAYEIQEKDLVIETLDGAPIICGEGEFGVVLKAKLNKNDNISTVAVKTLKGSDMYHLKSILSELKIMIWIGYHKNVVTLLGAVTRNLEERRVSVVVEYCSLGSLEVHIRKHRASYLDEFGLAPVIEETEVNENATTSQYVRIECSLKSSDLIRWAYEITTGMEYLDQRKVIHGDLALRNILLCGDRCIKITDFGLSKQLYKRSSNYITKRKDVLLPWRWLAIETLQDHNFSAQSDAWAFGVVLWEMFSLAEVPYTGVNFNNEFLRMLGNGYRLDRPRCCNAEIYGIMRECWRKEPSERPDFTFLRNSFAQMLPQGTIENYFELEVQSQNDNNRLKENLLLPNRIVNRVNDISV